MSAETVFLTVDVVLNIHRRMIEEFGGDGSIRDRGLMEAAIAMPRQRFDGKLLHENVAEQAAAYLYHICSNHAFVDGNKRTALAAAELFLLLNETQLLATNDELYDLTMGVARGSVDKKTATVFFQEHVRY